MSATGLGAHSRAPWVLLLGWSAVIGCSEGTGTAPSPPGAGSLGGGGGSTPSSGGTTGGSAVVGGAGAGTGGARGGASGNASGGVAVGGSSGGAAAGAQSSGGAAGLAGNGGAGAGRGGGAGAGGGGSGGASDAGRSGGADGGRGGGGAPGGAAGKGGAAGGSGGGGGAASLAGELDGFGWTMECNQADTSPDAQNRCYLLPPNGKCGSGYTSIDKTIQFGGTPGTTYQVALHLQGSQEAGDYSGGTAIAKQFLKNATHNDGLHNFLSMEVSAPKATYFPNAGAGGGTVTHYDYRVTIPIEGGATIHLTAFDKDCLQHRYCPDNTYKNCGFVLEPFSPASDPIDGDFLFITVESVTAM